jgi:hypothetical protein
MNVFDFGSENIRRSGHYNISDLQLRVSRKGSRNLGIVEIGQFKTSGEVLDKFKVQS